MLVCLFFVLICFCFCCFVNFLAVLNVAVFVANMKENNAFIEIKKVFFIKGWAYI